MFETLRQALGAATHPATLKAFDITAVLFVGINYPVFPGSLRAGNRAKLFLGLGSFLDFLLAGLALGTLLSIRKLLSLNAGLFSSLFSSNAFSFGLGLCFFAGFLAGYSLFLALSADRFDASAALSLMVDWRFGLDHWLGLEFGEKGLLRGNRGGLPVGKGRIFRLHLVFQNQR